MIIEITLALIISAFCSVVLGGYLAVRLPFVHRLFDRKPFNCRPCFTFHLMWVLTSVFALVARSFELFAVGVVAAFTVYIIVRKIENQKIEK